MATLLYVTANPKEDKESYSLTLGKEFLAAYKEKNPSDKIVELNLYRENIPLIDEDVFAGWGKLANSEDLDEVENQKVTRINELVDQFIEVDKYVFVTPLWNLSVPPMMKAYIDCIMIANKTFKYTEQGPIGLMKDKGKKALHIQSRGGFYSEGPGKELEMGDRLIQAIFNFIGIDDVQSVIMEGHAFDPTKVDEIKEKAIKEAINTANSF